MLAFLKAVCFGVSEIFGLCFVFGQDQVLISTLIFAASGMVQV